MLYTNLETNSKNKLTLKNPKNKVKIVSVFLFSVGVLSIATRLFAADTINWNFDTAVDYQLSDTNKIELAGGEVKLKQVTTTISDDTEGDFNSGTHLNTIYSNSNLTLGSSNLPIPTTESGLVAQYKLEGNPNDSKGSNNGIEIDGVGYVTGHIGSAGNFDGVNDSISINSTFGFTGTNLTIEAWVNLDSNSERGLIAKVGPGANGGAAIGVGGSTMENTGNNLILLYEGVRWMDTNVDIGTGWHHVAMVINASGVPSAYIDGRLIGTYPGSNAIAPVTTASFIGGYTASGFPRYLDAYIDEVSIYNIPLTNEKIVSNYNRNIGKYGEYTSQIFDTQAIDGVNWNTLEWLPSAPYGKELPNNKSVESSYSSGNMNMTDNLALWHFNNDWNDSSGSSLNGTPINNPAFSTSDVKFGSHTANFDGTDDQINLGTSNILAPSAVSVSAWVKTTSTGSMYIFSKKSRSFGGWHSYALNIGPMWASSSAGQVSARIQQSAAPSFIDFKTTKTVNDGKWHHIVLTFDSSRIGRIYIDGALEATSATGSNQIYYHTQGSSYIGHSKYCASATTDCAETILESVFNGSIDELAIFNRPLSLQEIGSMYQRGVVSARIQMRGCDDADCVDDSFVGSDGSASTYFADTQQLTLPSFSSNVIGEKRYMQYRTYFTTDNLSVKPAIISINNEYTSFAVDKPNVTVTNAIDLEGIPIAIESFCEGTLVSSDCTVTSTKPTNTEIYYQICNDTVANCNSNANWKYWNGSEWVNASNTQYNTAEEINSNLDSFTYTTRYFAFRSFLSSGGKFTPVLSDVSINVRLDLIDPISNASSLNAGVVTHNSWTNSKPVIQWTPGADDEEGTGILGYCIALDESNLDVTQNLNPETSAGMLQGLDDNVDSSYCPYIVTGSSVDLNSISGLNLTTGKQYNFSIKAVDIAGNLWNGQAEDYQDLFSFRYDATPPTNPAFISMPSNFISSKDATITWPVDGVNGSMDTGSGIAGLQYRIGQNGTWYGDLHNGNQDSTDLLVNDGAYSTSEEYDYANLVDGSNVIYLRTIDNAGNISSANVTGVLKINTTAPNQVANLEVSPNDSETNAYSFSWDAPSTFIGNINAITYCYTVNVIPSSNNCTYTSAGVTNIPTDAYATQPGTNIFYVVARDEAGNINYATYSTVEFTYSGEAPGIPLNLDVSDLSQKEAEDWKLAVTWAVPTNVGAGVSNYKVFRSSHASASCNVSMLNFTQVSTVLGTSYIDTNLEQQDYYYCVKACDSANNCSAPSTTDVQFPEGKYTEPAELISEPVVNTVTTKKAVITWVTDRRSDSKIQIGLSSNNYFEAESSVSAQVTAHTVTLDNLAAGTTYYYRAKWTDEDGNTGTSEEKSFTTSPPPSIIMTNVVNIGIDSALLQLRVSGTTKATILYGINNTFNSIKEISTSFTESTYTVPIDGLLDNSRYTYKIILEDIEGSEYVNLETNEFKTLPRPLVRDVSVEEIRNVAQPTVKVTWNSNTEISSIVNFYPENNPSAVQDSVILDRVLDHEVTIAGLLANTKYVLVVKGIDRFGNEAVSSPQVITTATDTRAPVISNIKVETVNPDSLENTSQIIVSWETDEVATSQVEYGEGTTGSYPQSTQVDRTYGYRHVVIITNLKPASVFHLRAISQDSSKNTTESMNIVTITPKQQENAFDIVLKGLGDIFSFL